MMTFHSIFDETVRIDTGLGEILGNLSVPERAWGAVVFADGCGTDKHYLRDPYLAESLQDLGFATLGVDLLTLADEDSAGSMSRRRFDFRVMTARLHAATDWLNQHCDFAHADVRIGYVGTSLGAAAALRAAAQRSDTAAVVSVGGQPDMAGNELLHVSAATLMIVGELDQLLIDSNRTAYEQLTKAYRREVAIIPRSTQYFDEHGEAETVSHLIRRWFVRYLGAATCRKRG